MKKWGYQIDSEDGEEKKGPCTWGDIGPMLQSGELSMRHLDEYEMKDADSVRLCDHCSAQDPKKRCSKCGIKYCSRECQVAAWRAGHKKVCKQVELAMAI